MRSTLFGPLKPEEKIRMSARTGKKRATRPSKSIKRVDLQGGKDKGEEQPSCLAHQGEGRGRGGEIRGWDHISIFSGERKRRKVLKGGRALGLGWEQGAPEEDLAENDLQVSE